MGDDADASLDFYDDQYSDTFIDLDCITAVEDRAEIIAPSLTPAQVVFLLSGFAELGIR